MGNMDIHSRWDDEQKTRISVWIEWVRWEKQYGFDDGEQVITREMMIRTQGFLFELNGLDKKNSTGLKDKEKYHEQNNT